MKRYAVASVVVGLMLSAGALRAGAQDGQEFSLHISGTNEKSGDSATLLKQYAGLKLMPGAKTKSKGEESSRAGVNFALNDFSMKMYAERYETRASREQVLDFYRNEMKGFGEVKECHGEFDLNHEKDAPPVMKCKESSGALSLGVQKGTEMRTVKVESAKPTEFSIVFLDIHKKRELIYQATEGS